MKRTGSIRMCLLGLIVGIAGMVGCSADTSGSGGRGGNNGGAGTVGAAGLAMAGAAGDGSLAGTGGDPIAGNGGAGGAIAGAGGAGGDSCTATGAEADVPRQGADIIWVVDNSCSMANEAAAVQSNMNRFTQQLIDKGVDVHLALISAGSQGGMPMVCPDGDWVCLANQIASGFTFGVCIDAPFGSGMCPADSRAPNFLHVPSVVGSNDLLVQIINNFPMYKSMIRHDSKKHFVIVSDDNSTQMTADQFTQMANALDPQNLTDWDFHGIFALAACPAASAPGTVYQTLVTQTGGVAADLCQQQFDPVFDTLAKDVVGKAQIACDWTIPAPPKGQTLDPTKVNVQYTTPDNMKVDLHKAASQKDCADKEGWYYDDDTHPTKVISCPASCTHFRASGGKVDVLFGCETVVVD